MGERELGRPRIGRSFLNDPEKYRLQAGAHLKELVDDGTIEFRDCVTAEQAESFIDEIRRRTAEKGEPAELGALTYYNKAYISRIRSGEQAPSIVFVNLASDALNISRFEALVASGFIVINREGLTEEQNLDLDAKLEMAQTIIDVGLIVIS
jgi:transcriptional regulator with XRE-family HTH domain